MYMLTFRPPLRGNLTVTIPTAMAPLCTVYLEDLHKQVFIVIFSAMESIIVSTAEKKAMISSKIARIHFQQVENC